MELHAVALATSQAGHMNPMLQLSRKLASCGFKVSFIIFPEFQEQVAAKIKTDQHIELVAFSEYIAFGSDSGLVEPLEELIQGLAKPVTCIISDSFIGWSQDLANRLGVPRVAFWAANATSLVMYSHLEVLDSKGYFPRDRIRGDSSLITFLPGLDPLPPSRLPLAFCNSASALWPICHSLARLKEARCVLVNTVQELEEEIVKASSYLSVGPLVETGAKNSQQTLEDEKAFQWLDEQQPRSVIYVAFGSGATLPVEQVEKIAQGLQLSQRPFLWALRTGFVTGAPEDFVSVLRARLSEQGMVVAWAAQAQVLGHPSVGCFLTHCGWNSALEAVCSGVPTLCWPCENEQNINAHWLVEKWKVGLQICEGLEWDGSGEDIAELICDMFGEAGNQLRTRIQQLKEMAAGASTPDGSSHRNLVNLARALQL